LPGLTSQAATAADREGATWDEFVGELRRRAGIDFRGYKSSHLERRVRGLALRSGLDGLSGLLTLLDRDPSARRELERCASVAVSEFFRTPRQFETLASGILPRLLARRRQLRIWSAGCSYGPEPYSLVLLLEELAPGRAHFILATDIDEALLSRARAADSFTERDLLHVRPRLRQHFIPSRPPFHALRLEIRSRVMFRRHDVLDDPPEDDFDLIVCRNVMMYFSPAAKQRLLQNLHRALRPGGYLFVGDAEAVNDLQEAGFSRDVVGFYRKELGVS